MFHEEQLAGVNAKELACLHAIIKLTFDVEISAFSGG